MPHRAAATQGRGVRATWSEETDLVKTVAEESVIDPELFAEEAEGVEVVGEAGPATRKIGRLSADAGDGDGSFLSKYFRDMATMDVLRPEEEVEKARRIETLELDLWATIFSCLPYIERGGTVVEQTLDRSFTQFRPLSRFAAKWKNETLDVRSRRRLKTLVSAVAEVVREADGDRRAIEMVMADLHALVRGEATVSAAERVGLSSRSAPFRRMVREAEVTMSALLRAKNDFVEANLRLVVSIARRFNHGRMALPDLIQEGNLGLMKAVERFDYRRGFRFSTYASWWIRHAISRALADKGREVRLPVHMIDAFHRLSRSRRDLTSRLGRPPSVEELSRETNIAPPKIEKMRLFLTDPSVSIDKTVSEDDARRVIDVMLDPWTDATQPADQLANFALTSEAVKLLDGLRPIEAEILRQRFGLDAEGDGDERTLKEIGRQYNLSRERIRQLQEQALGKMRRALQRKDMM